MQSYREGDKVKQRIVAHLGRKDLLAPHLDTLIGLLQEESSSPHWVSVEQICTPRASTWGPILVARKSTRTYKGKTYTNHLLVASFQTPKGPRQRTICSLGSLEPAPAEDWLGLAHKLQSVAGTRVPVGVCDRNPSVGGESRPQKKEPHQIRGRPLAIDRHHRTRPGPDRTTAGSRCGARQDQKRQEVGSV
ncbi:MAG: hypothetical protein DMG30_05825 [Acidobacteria bacterium]|nr:MAG: hypothetical protein DMG30_05825 [Acidobacteriota bacterium]